MKKLVAAIVVLAFSSTCFAASGVVKWQPPKKFGASQVDEAGVVKGPKGTKKYETEIGKKEEAPAAGR